MRVTDHRYTRDLLRHDLALRMIRHEARTCTIRLCTGLTDDRIRKLYRSYVAASPDGVRVRRKRGRSPRQAAYFTRNPPVQLQASLLAGIFAAIGLLEDGYRAGGAQASRTLEFGALFCDAFEAYLQVWYGSKLSFEHAWCLLTALADGGDLQVARCPVCSGAFVHDTLALGAVCCPLCCIRTGERSARLLACRGRGLRRRSCP